jgi:glutathione synthase
MAGFVFLMDPIERIHIAGDSTFVLMLEAQKRGHALWYAQPSQLFLQHGRAWVTASPVKVTRHEAKYFSLEPAEAVDLNQVDAVFMRRDPPFDVDYLVATYLLDFVDPDRVVLVNDPQGLRDLNEKLSAVRWPALMPPTQVTSQVAHVRALADEWGDIIVKPLMFSGGSGIVRLGRNDVNLGSVVDLLTGGGRQNIQVQRYLPEIQDGDKRIVLLDGRPIGAILRRPQASDTRANLHVGGTAEAVTLNPRDLEICDTIGPELSRRGIVFAGIDVIGAYLTEINVTSPTGLQEINRLSHVCLEAEIIDWVEARMQTLG